MSTWRREGMFYVACTLLFVGSVIVTTLWCRAMSGMGSMPMPGHWLLSMAWMPMDGQTWLDLAVSFLGMWTVMMVAMMLPSLFPVLRHYRHAITKTGLSHVGRLTVSVGTGYFFVWAVLGMVIFPLGAGFSALAMQWPALARAVPVMIGVVVVIAGALQFTAWKARQWVCCRPWPMHGCSLPTNNANAWRYGVLRGLHCSYCCTGMTAILIVNGVMDLGVMGVVTVAITVERLSPSSTLPRAIGIIVITVGIGMIAQAFPLAH